jgi:Glyoxalase-like domain
MSARYGSTAERAIPSWPTASGSVRPVRQTGKITEFTAFLVSPKALDLGRAASTSETCLNPLVKGTPTVTNTLFGISFDCTDASAVARFWGAVLDRQVEDGATSDNAVLLADDQATSGPRLAFHRVPEAKVVKNRLHLDLVSDRFESETQRLTGLGAEKIRDVQGDEARWTTFVDIEGNEFDLIAG